MAIDVRATVTCSLGTLISAQIADDYIQGQGLIKCRGSCELKGLYTPAVGTVVTFSYTKGSTTRDIPRTLRVLSSFADPFRNTTSVSLGCKLTYLADKRERIQWTPLDDPINTGLTADDQAIITLPISAAYIMTQCLFKLGITATGGLLTNTFSIARFDMSAGYVSILSDLLVSESLCGYLDQDEVLQLFSLDQAGGTGPVLDSTKIIDLDAINAGNLPGESVVVSYSSLKLSKTQPYEDAQQETTPTPPTTEEKAEQDKKRNWEKDESIGFKTEVNVPNPFYTNNPYPFTVPQFFVYTHIPRSETVTKYDTLDRVTERTTTTYTILAQVAPGLVQSRAGTDPRNGPSFGSDEYVTVETEVFEYKVAAPSVAPATPPAGYEEVKKRTVTTEEPLIALAASTQIYNIAGNNNVFFSWQMGQANRYTSQKQEITYQFSKDAQGAQITKTLTAVYVAVAATTQGQQMLATVINPDAQLFTTTDGVTTSNGYAEAAILKASQLKFLGTQSQIATGREIGLEKRPPAAERVNATAAKPQSDQPATTNATVPNTSSSTTNQTKYATQSTQNLVLASGSMAAERIVTFSVPYSSDDRFTKVGSDYVSTPSDADSKARQFGRVQNRLLLGNRSGMSIQTAPELLPEAPFSPIIVQASGLSGLYRTNAMSWTMNPEGVVLGTDALFWGAVGGNGTFWFPVAPGITTLPTTPAVVDGQMTVSTPVPVWNETVVQEARLRVVCTVQSLPYALQTTTELTAGLKVRAAVVRFTPVPVPAAAVAVAALAPDVSTGAAVAVPAASFAVAAVAPAT